MKGPTRDALPIVFTFPGHGSQYYGMGSELYGKNELFRRHLDGLDAIAASLVGYSILERLYDPAKRRTDDIVDPALSSLSIFMIECAMARTLLHNRVTPSRILASSLGIFAACVAAGCIGEEQMLRLIYAQGEIFSDSCPPGCMISILANPNVYTRSPVLRELSELAGSNFELSFVIALPLEHRAAVESELRAQRLVYQTLPVRLAYHSRWIDAAKDASLRLLGSVDFAAPQVPVVCSAKTASLDRIDAHVLWSAMREQMRFADAVRHVEATGPHFYLDVGPSGGMAAFIRHGLEAGSRSKSSHILTPFKDDVRRLDAALAALAG